jgi:hypothetical protein
MTYERATWLPEALRAEGCQVVTVDGWQSRGRPASSGDFDPYAALWHHTATTSSPSNPNPTLGMCIRGRPDLPGPLCQVLIGYDGKCHVIAAGRANHAGECNGAGPTFRGDGNAQMVGFEIDYNGSQKMSDVQYDAAIKAATAVVRHFDNDHTYCLGHKETSVTGKPDPGGYDCDDMRADVRTRLRGGGEDDDMPEYVSLSGPGFDISPGGDWAGVRFDTENADPGGVHTDDTGYPWLKLAGAKYDGVLALNDVGAEPGAVLSIRWAEYATDNGEFRNAVGATDHVLPDQDISLHDPVVDVCGKANKVRVEVRSRGGTVSIGSVGVRVLYWR